MGRWLEQSAQELAKITDRMHELLLDCNVLQVDESPYDLIDKNRAGKKIKKGYVWTLFGDALAPYVYFQFQADRTGETAQKLIKGFSGFLVTDGYGGYDWYRADRSANCNVHSRRYFEKALKCDKKKAGAILALYSKLYKIEETLKGKSEEEILLVRHEQSLPIMNQMHTLLQSWRLTEPPKTSLGVAINYALSRWDQLVLFTKHAVIPLDTNLVENAIRAIAIGRNNWLKISSFVNSLPIDEIDLATPAFPLFVGSHFPAVKFETMESFIALTICTFHWLSFLNHLFFPIPMPAAVTVPQLHRPKKN